MTSDRVSIQQANLLDENYGLLPYIKVNEENMMILNNNMYKQSDTSESILCVPVTETLFDYNMDNSFVEQHNRGDTFTNDHSYNTSTHKNLMNICWPPKKEIKNLECHICKKVLKTPGAFYRHLRIHTGEKPFQCQRCDKKFSQQSNLWKHVLIHTGERRFECTNCGKKFSQRANMQKHMMVHTGEKPFTCYVCSKTFTQRANLNKHIRTHTGEKPYSCKYCSRLFAQQSNMQKHELIHQGVKPFTCKICPAAFTQQNNLKRHLEIHNNLEKFKSDNHSMYTCNACNRSFNTANNLFDHMENCSNVDKSNIVIKLEEPSKEEEEDMMYANYQGNGLVDHKLPVKHNKTWQNLIVSKDLFISE